MKEADNLKWQPLRDNAITQILAQAASMDDESSFICQQISLLTSKVTRLPKAYEWMRLAGKELQLSSGSGPSAKVFAIGLARELIAHIRKKRVLEHIE